MRRTRRIIAAFALALAGGLAGAQVAPAPAPAVDTLAQRVAACTACHGREGRTTNEGYFPRIAGKPALYLYHQLLNFRDGRRNYAVMTYLLEHLTDAYLMEIAQHFSALDLPYPPPAPVAAPPAQLALGRRVATEGDAARKLPACVQCHGAALAGVVPAIPGLLGLPRDYLVAQLGAWRSDIRRAQAPDCMKAVALQLTPEEIGAVSAWLAAQPVPPGTHPAAGLPAPLPLPCGGVAP